MTVAELRRRLTPGVRVVLVRAVYLKPGEQRGRTVARVQSRDVALARDEKPDGALSWLPFPKASQLIETDGGFIIRDHSGDPKYDLEYVWA